MKKFMSILLAAALTVSLGVTAMAATGDAVELTPVNDGKVTFNKTFTVTSGDTRPAATFTFEAAAPTYSHFYNANAIAPDNLSALNLPTTAFSDCKFEAKTYTNGDSKTETETVTVTLPTAYKQIGKYDYTIKEIVATPAIGYDDDLHMVVIVTNVLNNGVATGNVEAKYVYFYRTAGEKIEDPGFENKYPVTTLSITKQVAGEYADVNDVFHVEVKLDSTGATTRNQITITGATNVKFKLGTSGTETSGTTITDTAWTEATVSFDIKHGETVYFNGMTAGIQVTVTEVDFVSMGYSASYASSAPLTANASNVTGTMTESPAEVTITNTRDVEPPTGISLDSLPYLVLLGGVAVGLAIVFLAKRKRCEDQL